MSRISAADALLELRRRALTHLTARQRDVLQYLILGYNAGRIAQIIRFSQRTVEYELSAIRACPEVKEALEDYDLAFLREEGMPLTTHAIVRAGQVANVPDATLLGADKRFNRSQGERSRRVAVAPRSDNRAEKLQRS